LYRLVDRLDYCLQLTLVKELDLSEQEHHALVLGVRRFPYSNHEVGHVQTQVAVIGYAFDSIDVEPDAPRALRVNLYGKRLEHAGCSLHPVGPLCLRRELEKVHPS